MYTDTCFLCFTKNRRTFNIVNTHLQPVYEKLAESKIENEFHNLCFVCHTRLQQSYQFSILAKQNQHLLMNFMDCYDKAEEELCESKALVELSLKTAVKLVIPYDIDEAIREASFNNTMHAGGAPGEPIIEEEEEVVKIKVERDYIGENSQDYEDNQDYYDNENFQNFPESKVDVLLGAMPELGDNFVDEDVKLEKTVRGKVRKRQQHYMDTKMIDGLAHYVCHFCPFANRRKMNVVIHERQHTGNKPFTCHICNRTFARKSNLNAHYNTHSGNKPHKCDVCKRSFAALGALTRHKRIHTGEKPFSCDICMKRFADKFHLKTHINTHTGHRPHNCDICNQNFADLGGLNRHRRVHTGEKPYTCEVCNRKFSDKSHLNAHKFIHLGYKLFACDVCGKKFSQSGSLRWHKRKHMGMKSYTCDICDRSFKEKGHLKEHMNMHTGNKPYNCKFCDQKFCHSSSRYRHQRTHMIDEPHTFCEVELMPMEMESEKEANAKFISKAHAQK